MQLSDIFFVLHWWLVLLFVGLIFVSFTSRFFSHFFDKGYVFSKMFGMSFTAYTIFLLGTLHVLSFSQWGIYLVLLFWFILFHVRFARNPNRLLFSTSFFKLIKSHWRIFLFEEILFLAGLFFLSYIRSFSPDIHGLEKYMDFGFI